MTNRNVTLELSVSRKHMTTAFRLADLIAAARILKRSAETSGAAVLTNKATHMTFCATQRALTNRLQLLRHWQGVAIQNACKAQHVGTYVSAAGTQPGGTL